MADGEKSITWIVAAVMLVIAGFGWGFLAGSYDGAHSQQFREMSPPVRPDSDIRVTRRPGVVTVAVAAAIKFTYTAFAQLPNLPSVIVWHFSNRVWLPLTIVVLEILAVVGGYSLKTLESKLAQPYRRRR
jgi:hypothetical protein